MRCILVILASVLSAMTVNAGEQSRNAYDFSFKTISGEPLPFSEFRGKLVMVVNTASECGFTGQYKNLQTVWSRYRDKGFVVLGVPSNDFGNQEPGEEAQIKSFCEVNFDVDFPLTSKVHVTGDDAHPFYRWASDEMGLLAKPRWNFHKYLVGTNGQIVNWFSTPTSPTSEKIIKTIEEHLGKSSSNNR